MVKLLSDYWFIYIIFVPLGCAFGRKFFVIYDNNPLKYLADIFGLSYLFYGHDATMNVTWWFMSIIIIYYIIFPLLYKIQKYSPELLLLISAVILFIVPDFRELTVWLLPFTFGMYATQRNLFELADKLLDSKMKIVIPTVLVILFAYLRKVYFGNSVYIDTFFAFSIILFSCFVLSKIPVVNKILESLGKYSSGIFMMHTFIFSYYFHDFIYSFKYAIPIFIVLTAICYVICVLINQLKNLTRYNILIKLITNKIDGDAAVNQKLTKLSKAYQALVRSSMKKLAVIGANDFQNQLILKAKSLGYETHVFAWEDGAVGKDNADFFYPISIVEKEKILEKCREIKPEGICSIASDLAAITVNFVAENLGLPCNKTEYTAVQTNKYKMRGALSNAGIPCPKFVLADETFDVSETADFKFPIIVKPTDRSGSRCIMKLENTDGLAEAVKNACAVSFEHRAIIEEYINGNEYSMETVSQNGKHYYLATTKKYTTGAPHFIETAHKEPSGLPPEINEKAVNTVMKALDALHIENSAGHSEFKVDKNGDIAIIEIGARMGGDCIGSDLVHLSTGCDFVKMVIDIACGNELEIPDKKAEKDAEIHFMFTENDLDRLEELKKTCPDRLYRVSDIEYDNLGNVTDSGSRLGYYILY